MAKFVCALCFSLSIGGSCAWLVAEEERPIGPLAGAEPPAAAIVLSGTNPRSQFTCPSALGATNQECVDKNVNGHCPYGSQCFARADLFKNIDYGICCCVNQSTPVWEAIGNRWSCRIQKMPNPKGAEPICDIFCCTHDGKNGTNRRLAATRCTWLEPQWDWPFAPRGHGSKWGWPFALPGSSSRHCCTGDDGASCQTNCNFGKLCCLLSVFTMVVAIIAVHCSRKILWKRHLGITIVVLVAQGAIAWLAAWKAGHAELDSVLWVVLTCAPMLLLYLSIRLRKWYRQRRAAHECRDPARLAVILTIENYAAGAYGPVPDKDKDALAKKLADLDWNVRCYSAGGRADFESIRETVQSHLEGTEDSEVMLYISCHSFIVGDVPVILQSDADRCTGSWRSRSLYTMIREMNQVSSINPSFIVFFNGCLVRPTCNRWWRFTFCACRRRGGLPQLRMGQRRVSICSACAPGEEAFVENSLSKALVEALEEGRGRRPIFQILQEKLASGSPPQTLFVTGTESQIILDRTGEAD